MKEIKESKRPGVVLIHRDWCSACKTIGKFCRDDIPLIKMSKKFVMISCPNGEEPQDDTFKMGTLRPHHFTDRPKTVPAGSRNLGFVGAFSRLEKGFCLTGNYAVSSARSTVDELMHAGKWAGGTGERKKSRTGKWLTIYKVVSSLYRAGL